jgi:hypothetical protein
MIQTRYMKKNNVTFEENEARDYHTKNYNENNKICPSSWATLVNKEAKQNINHIFDYFNQDRYAYRGDNILTLTRKAGRTYQMDTDHPWNSRIDFVNVIIFRYERQRDRIKREVAEVCKHCSESW